EACEGRRVVADAVDAVAVEAPHDPFPQQTTTAGDGELVADADARQRDEVVANQVDFLDAIHRRADPAHGKPAQLLVVEVPVGEAHGQRAVTGGPTVVVRVGNGVGRRGRGGDLDQEASAQAGVDVG